MAAGTGGNPELGEQAAQESLEALGSSVGNADMVRTMLSYISWFSDSKQYLFHNRHSKHADTFCRSSSQLVWEEVLAQEQHLLLPVCPRMLASSL